MTLGILTRESVDLAVTEFDKLGRDSFLEKYGFRRATKYALIVDDKEYDPKAIAGVAHGYDHPDEGPLKPQDFSGGLVLRRAFSKTGYHIIHSRPSSRPEIRALIESFLDTYLEAKSESFSGSRPAFQLMQTIRSEIAATGPVDDRKTLRVEASVGQGNWAGVPWIAILDNRETTTTQEGLYPVLLFRQDMTGVYVTVAQGVTKLRNQLGAKKMQTILKENADRVIRHGASEAIERSFKFGTTPDIGSSQLARDYELSVIAYKFYGRDNVPSDQEILDDIELVISIAEEDIESRFNKESESSHNESIPTNEPSEAAKIFSTRDIVNRFRFQVNESGVILPAEVPDRATALLCALIAKPFVIITGMSGSGKTQLALRLGEWFGHTSADSPRFLNAAVRPDWTGPEFLFGYEDALRPSKGGRAAWHVPPVLEFLLQASDEPDMPYLLLLDEMNLAHVERYFSDYLSGSESRSRILPNLSKEGDEWRVPEGEDKRIPIPRNVMVVGTVNVDETTYQFSPKVLDRATTFEVRTSTEELDAARSRPSPIAPAPMDMLRSLTLLATDDSWHLSAPSVSTLAANLKRLHELLTATDNEFGHRTFQESLRLAASMESAGVNDLNSLLDQVVLLKVLPKLHGSRRKIGPVLETLLEFASGPSLDSNSENVAAAPTSVRLPSTASKLKRMQRNLDIHQFVSFMD